ncbi:LysR family transcriptional regulator [Maridesulfovibrio zosterae]|uniref:LysR family transcriptional regulator n=1 Tax=Maridesulfovibrio zosterae TaxID=82171 RepID=UPI0004202DEB|nr:LysR family transcriptional regulator [Maridesulfovibrio zosterae]
MEIRHLISFKAIVEHGSFIRAAKALNYAQSSITSHIQALEDYYGHPLFDRIGKKVILNSFGSRVYKYAIPFLASYDGICELHNISSEPSGTLYIGAPESTLIYRLSPILRQYKKQYPAVEVIMQNSICSDMRKALKNGELDLAILLEGEVEESDLIFKPLYEEPMSIIMPGDYPSSELINTGRHAVIYTEKGCSYRSVFQKFLAEKGIKADNIIETASIEVIKQYVLCDIGVSFLPYIVVRNEIESGKIKHIKCHSDNPVMVRIAYHKNKWISPAMAEFIRLVVVESRKW